MGETNETRCSNTTGLTESSAAAYMGPAGSPADAVLELKGDLEVYSISKPDDNY